MWNWIKSFFKKPEVQPVAKGWNSSWSDHLRKILSGETLEIFNSAQDIQTLKKDFKVLNKSQQIEILAEFFKALAYYESGYDPRSQSVDVGTYSNKDTWSIGLLQLSVIDQSNLGLRLGYEFNDLLDPIKNLDFGIEIMKNQIKKRGKIFIHKGEKGNPALYWATLCPGGKYDKSLEIIEWVSKTFKGTYENILD